MASTNLASEFSNFSKLTKQLRQILRDTQRCFADINSVSTLEQGSSLRAELTQTEESEIASIIKRPPCLLILGQSVYSKAFLTNEIFGMNILPPLEYDRDSSEVVRWRTVRFKYGDKSVISLSLPGSYELVDNLAAYNQAWQTIPREDLELQSGEQEDTARDAAVVDVQQCHPLLRDGGQVLVVNNPINNSLLDTYEQYCDDIVPIPVYAFSDDTFSQQELKELQELKKANPTVAMFFIRIPPPVPKELSQAFQNNKDTLKSIQSTLERHSIHKLSNEYTQNSSTNHIPSTMTLFQQLLDADYLSVLPSSDSAGNGSTPVESELVENFDCFMNIALFVRKVLMRHLVSTTTLMNVVHTRCLQMFIFTAFDMTRDLLITPRRLEFAREKETELYASLMNIALRKQDEIRRIIATTVETMRDELISRAANHEFKAITLPESGAITSPRDFKICTGEIQELVLAGLNSAIAGELLGSVDILKDSYTGVLTRCLESLERYDRDQSEAIRTSIALREILNAAYQVEITVRSGSSFIRVLLEKMKQLIQGMPWKTPPMVTREWKEKVAADMLASLSESRLLEAGQLDLKDTISMDDFSAMPVKGLILWLARSICAQIKDRLKHSHDTFAIALKQLETKHSGRLERTEEKRLKLRKVHAPKVARLALDSTSLRDLILYGMPNMGREVGRGQYGVVYSCDSWAGHSPCAIKSVVPPDDKHWNDLALEFYYTKNVPEHERIVALRGSVIDYTYGGGSSPAVLLVMDRYQRDLYAAIKAGLDWLSRLQVSIDVVEGIRFLHSQGLVHRDIKLKNVLLNRANRGHITDLGFCKPEAMMSGSIVGTPIHMAPELFTGKYDNSVDVYAFGVLFWYVCAGHVRLPYNFEQCTSKDMLWTSVRRGVRPERLKNFDVECWTLMNSCWEGEPSRRPLLGHVEPQLYNIKDRYKKIRDSSPRRSRPSSPSSRTSSPVNFNSRPSSPLARVPTPTKLPNDTGESNL